MEAGWRGTEIHIRYYEFKREGTEESKDEVKAMQLVNTYKENIRRSTENKANKLRELLNGIDPGDLSKEALNDVEKLVFLALVLRKCSHKFRDKCDVVGYQCKNTILEYVRKHKTEANRIMRDFMRDVLGGSDVTWNTDLQECQSLILQHWASDKVEEVNTEYDLKLAKKQEKIEAELNTLGYDTDGKKLQS